MRSKSVQQNFGEIIRTETGCPFSVALGKFFSPKASQFLQEQRKGKVHL